MNTCSNFCITDKIKIIFQAKEQHLTVLVNNIPDASTLTNLNLRPYLSDNIKEKNKFWEEPVTTIVL